MPNDFNDLFENNKDFGDIFGELFGEKGNQLSSTPREYALNQGIKANEIDEVMKIVKHISVIQSKTEYAVIDEIVSRKKK